MEYDMNLRVREMVVQRLDDAVEQMQRSATTEKYPQLIRLLVESCLWLIRDWPGQQIDDFESVRASRKEVEGRLRQFLRVRPQRTCEMESNILLVSDAILAISEQWPVDKSDKPSSTPAPEPISAPPQRVISVQKRPHLPNASTFASTPVNALSHANGRPVYGSPGTSSQQPAAKITRIVASSQQLSNSPVNSFPQPTPYRSWEQPHRMPQSNNAGTPSRLWSFFTKVMGESGENLARCNVCQRVVPRQNHGTSGMKNHLKAHHPQEFSALDRDPSIRTEPAHSSPHFVSMEERQPRKRTASPEKTPPSVAAIVAALHGPTTICLSDDGSYSPLFNEATVKEEEVDFEEEMEKYKAASKINGEPNEAERAMLNEQLASLQKPRAVTSDIWTYFTKEDAPNGEKFGSCKLCDWSKKIHNHGTNGMWGHLKKHHPPEYSILKPYEYNPAVHGQFIPSSMPGCAVVPGGSVVIVPGGILPANLVLPRPMEAGEELVKDEEDKL